MCHVLRIIVLLVATAATTSLHAQLCSFQTQPDCECTYQEYDFTICHGGVNYSASITMCTQYAVTQALDNQCTQKPGEECFRGADAITWVRRICVDQNLKNIGELAIYNAIIKGTNLCCSDGLVKANIPACDPGTACKESTVAFCHLLMLPKCVTKNFTTGCYDYCGNGCDDYCVVERRYCMTGPGNCCMYSYDACEYNSDGICNQNCATPLNLCGQLDVHSQVCCD